MRLSELASIQTGYPFRSRIERNKNGNVCVIQLRDIGEDGRFNSKDLVCSHLPDIQERHLVQVQDIVLRSRGKTNTGAIIDREIGAAVLAGPLLRIRVTSDKVLPSYLHWYINQQTAQIYLARRSKGTAVRMISAKAVQEMEIPLPPIEKQKQIVELAVLEAKEQQLLGRLAEKRKQYIENILMKLTLDRQESQGQTSKE